MIVRWEGGGGGMCLMGFYKMSGIGKPGGQERDPPWTLTRTHVRAHAPQP